MMRRVQETTSTEKLPVPVSLSARQRECLKWAALGKSARDTGEIIGISQRTVESHLSLACELLGVRTRIQAVVAARELGLLSGPNDPN